MKPLDLVASMVLENGHRWGECATEDQWADMTALLDGTGPRRHFWLRARGRSKTWDAGAATVAMMLCGDVKSGDEMYAAAAGRVQAGLLAKKIQQITSNTTELAGAVVVQQYQVITPRTKATLDVLSSDLATAWGKTPRWLFVDEVCNHDGGERDEGFIDALLTALVKRRDSVCLMGSTPSAPQHWSRKLWDNAVTSKLWRASMIAGPAPWQDPEELAEEMGRLADFMWRRLFECEWAAADDALADEAALKDCTRHDGPLPYRSGTACVVTFDLSDTKDHTAVCVAHAGDRDGKREVVIDRLQAWVPPKGGHVDLDDVEQYIDGMAREYGGAMIVGDPWQAVSMIRRLREKGHQVKPAVFSAGNNSRRAQVVMRLLRDRALDLPDDPILRKEFLSLRLAEGVTPGTLKLTSDGSAQGHHDRVTTVMLAAEELLSRPGESWRDYCGKTIQCLVCRNVFLVARPSCPRCGTVNPDAPPEQAREPVAASASPYAAQPGSWAAAYLPADALRCGRGHIWSASGGTDCPHCRASQTSTGIPPAVAGVLAGLRGK